MHRISYLLWMADQIHHVIFLGVLHLIKDEVSLVKDNTKPDKTLTYEKYNYAQDLSCFIWLQKCKLRECKSYWFIRVTQVSKNTCMRVHLCVILTRPRPNYSPSTWTDKYITKKASVRRKNNTDTLLFGAAILLQNVLTQRGCLE